MSLSQVVPAESERQEDSTESIDLFEVLEDRYAYEGFNTAASIPSRAKPTQARTTQAIAETTRACPLYYIPTLPTALSM